MKKIVHILTGIAFFFAVSTAVSAQGGITPETATPATLDSNNVADGKMDMQYYAFTPVFNGFVSIGNCGQTESDTYVAVFDSTNLWYAIAYNDDYCGSQSQVIMQVDSAVPYVILWQGLSEPVDETFTWYLVKTIPEAGLYCEIPIAVSEDTMHVTLEKYRPLWYEYTAKATGNAVIHANVDISPISMDCFLGVYPDCNTGQINPSYINTRTIAFNITSGTTYKIYFNCMAQGSLEMEWQITEEPAIEGDRCETALVADTGTNTFHSGLMTSLFYSYHSKRTGKTTVSMCNVPDTIITNLSIREGKCDEYLPFISSQINNACDDQYINQNYSYSFYTDSGRFYSLVIDGESYADFTWDIHDSDPEPGEFFQVPVDISMDDTLYCEPVNGLSSLWYRLVAENDEMIILSGCGLGNDPYALSVMRVFEDSVSQQNVYMPKYFQHQLNCMDGMKLEFPARAGRTYYIQIYYSNTAASARWCVQSRAIREGDVCESTIPVEKDILYEIPPDRSFSWYHYTPAEDAYVVVGNAALPEEDNYPEITVKLDCTCEPVYYNEAACTRMDAYGQVLALEAGEKYHIGWTNRNYKNISWSIYDPTRIMDFRLKNQLEPAEIDHENHTIHVLVMSTQALSDIFTEFIQASGVDFLINKSYIYSGDRINYTQPVTLTVQYINYANGDTLVQDWIVTVTQADPQPTGPYTVKSEYLLDPVLNKPNVTRWADFWKTAYDHEQGGFYTNVGDKGDPLNERKALLSQSRNAYAFARAFMISGDTSYLSYANGALQFMYDHLWDPDNGGWYSSVDRYGNLLDNDMYNTYKWSFIQHYAKIGMIAMADAVGGARFENENLEGKAFHEHLHWNKLKQSLDVINESMWDDRPGYYGYYNFADLNWENPHEKGFTPTVDGITTHGLYMFLLTRDPFFENRLEQLADNMEEHLIAGMENAVMGFPEVYSSDWEVETGGDMFIGHMFKTSWCLARAYLVNPKEKYRRAAKTLFFNMTDNGGYDYLYGAPYSAYNWEYGQVNTSFKSWWDTEQAYTSGIMNYYISDDEEDKNKYLEVADGSIDFFMEHFVDEEDGEVYNSISRKGGVSDETKGSYWKAGYHSTEFAYYAYLYGNLFYKDEPVDLYYFIDRSDQPQSVSLYPLAIEDHFLRIDAVELDGTRFDHFNGNTRTLNIAANEGGIFKVTFVNDKFNGFDEPLADNEDMLKAVVYPNPLSESGTIEYTIGVSTDVTLQILDITGRVLRTIKHKNAPPGTYRESIHRSELGTGRICLINIQTASQRTTKKLILVD